MARAAALLCAVAFVASAWSGEAVQVAQRRRRRASGFTAHGRSPGGDDHSGFGRPLHSLKVVPARLLPADDPLPAMVIAPDVVVNPADENDVPVAPTIIDLERPLAGGVGAGTGAAARTEVSLPAEGRAAAAAAMAGLNASALASMTTLQKIHALMPAANAAAVGQVQEVASLAAGLFKEAQEMARGSLEAKLRSQVAQAKLRSDLDAAAARNLADKAEIARLRQQLAVARAKNARSLREEAALQKQLDQALGASVRGGAPAQDAAAADGADEAGGARSEPTEQSSVMLVPTSSWV